MFKRFDYHHHSKLIRNAFINPASKQHEESFYFLYNEDLTSCRQLRIIRRALTNDTAHSVVRALIHNRIDYCDGVLASSPKYLIAKLQSVLRVAARLILRLPSRSSVSASMRVQLHWLNMDERISFKIALLAYKSIHGLAPAYLSSYCIPVSSLPGRSHLR